MRSTCSPGSAARSKRQPAGQPASAPGVGCRCNSAAAEYLARWAYALGRTFEECQKKEHWQGDKKNLKTRWDLFKRYDVWSISKGNTRVDGADNQVTENMKRDAIFLKYLDRVTNP